MIDVLGEAIHDYYFKTNPSSLWIHNTYGEKESMPVKVYFRRKEKMPRLEQIALQECTGKVLDIGAGAGSHALALQKAGFDVTAMDISAKNAAVMKKRGVANVEVGDAFHFNNGTTYDTLLLLMNGIGLVGNVARLRTFLQHAKTLLNKDGQMIFDSSDVAYLYDYSPPKKEKYYGEVFYQYEYKDQKTEWFTWLYIDKALLSGIADEEGWDTALLYEDNHDQYLVKLTLKA